MRTIDDAPLIKLSPRPAPSLNNHRVNYILIPWCVCPCVNTYLYLASWQACTDTFLISSPACKLYICDYVK
jgi:hypothetical protein